MWVRNLGAEWCKNTESRFWSLKSWMWWCSHKPAPNSNFVVFFSWQKQRTAPFHQLWHFRSVLETPNRILLLLQRFLKRGLLKKKKKLGCYGKLSCTVLILGLGFLQNYSFRNNIPIRSLLFSWRKRLVLLFWVEWEWQQLNNNN